MLVENLHFVAGAGELLAAHSPRGSAADDRNVCHVDVSLTAPRFRARGAEPVRRLARPSRGHSIDRKHDQSKSSEEYSTEERGRQRRPGTLSDNLHAQLLQQAK